MKNKKTEEELKQSNQRECEHHCYCQRIWVNDQEHLVCCMCGHRTLVNKITF